MSHSFIVEDGDGNVIRTEDGGDRRFRNALDRIWEMHLKKSHDYGQDEDIYANVRASEKFGVPAWMGAMIRANDKVHRLAVYAEKGELRNEGVEDSFMDLASYAIIAYVLYLEEAGGHPVDG